MYYQSLNNSDLLPSGGNLKTFWKGYEDKSIADNAEHSKRDDRNSKKVSFERANSEVSKLRITFR